MAKASGTPARRNSTAAVQPTPVRANSETASAQTPAQTPANTLPPAPMGMATLQTLRLGCKLFVKKDGEWRKAEILQFQQRHSGMHYYVHYSEFNKRLDEWVPADRLDLSREVEWPRLETTKKRTGVGKVSSTDSPAPGKARPGKAQPGKAQKRPAARNRRQSELPGTPNAETPMTERQDSMGDGLEPPETPAAFDDDMMDIDQDDAGHRDIPEVFSKEQEIEKLRTSGSMTQSAHEVARVKNLNRMQIGKFEVEPWYFSPYPVELTMYDMIFVCEFCLSYYGSRKQYERHRHKCTLQHPPGNEIYRDGKVSFFEIDGRKQRTWCRNLCLLSKCFLDHKTLYYDVDPFLFYVMTERDEYGCHVIGYFSKEKESADGYNVACILTLPQYQRHGWGRLLIAFSYLLSKNEGKQGSPEKPLSDLGLLSYRAYWSDLLIDLLLSGTAPTETTIDEIASKTSMTTNDVVHTLQTLNMLKYYKGQHIICLTDAVVQQHEKQSKKRKREVQDDCLQWKPPVFTAAQLRFGY
ncbi:hypothetical protein G7K_5094-t1 [Saitoella complicata NRRL Y-17804]|uniref:histone acetyltransferase n=2 Tax=Saitoella complicata (strain BCRC 22490 / CBS 7301 / JCM 7358 / NBRC 10748 / NRRL Y-17804) TaxID=698492 RepID=A0A0E9NMB6_SAICN|nr:hypothetical protein G7K_5094-t1 [Saitoella complicata NRRL Y-17804]